MTPRPPHLRRRRDAVLLISAAALALAVAGHALLWRHAADRLAAGVASWIAERRALGWHVEHAVMRVAGWPFAVTARLPAVRLEGAMGTLPSGVSWQAESVTLRLAPLWSERLAVALGGRQVLRLGAITLPFAADRLDLSIPLAGGALPRAGEILAERLRVGVPAGPLELGRLAGGVETMRTAVEGEAAIALRLDASSIALPPQWAAQAGPLGRVVEAFSARIAMTGPWPRGDGARQRAEAWRDLGGSLEMAAATLAWGPIELQATATLALDEALQPMGGGTLRLTGAVPLLEAAAAAGLLPRGQLPALLGFVRWLEASAGDDGLSLPVILEGQELAVARVPVLRLPRWEWPAAE